MTTLMRCTRALLVATAFVASRPLPALAWQPAGSPLAFDPASCNVIPPGEFTKEGRLGAMLSVHASAYFDDPVGVLAMNFKTPPLLLDKAALFLRCDKDPLSLSRRRRAIAKLGAYGWPGRFTQELIVLGLNVDLFRSAVSETIPGPVLRSALLNRSYLEFLFARLLHERPRLIADGDGDECDDQPESPYDPPFANDTVTQISIETYVSVKPPMKGVYPNVDPQRWDECSKFWPTPDKSMTAPLDPHLGSTYIATTTSADCSVTAGEIQPEKSPPAAGATYPPAYFFEQFVCKAPPCDATFQNLLSIKVDEGVHDVLMVGKFWTHRVDYGFPRCTTNGGYDAFDGGISSQVDAQSPSPKVVLDEGTMDVWEETDDKGVTRTHVRGHKKVKFDNPVQNGSAGVALGFTELNEELAEVACCLKHAGPP